MLCSKPKISIVMSSIRPNLWRQLLLSTDKSMVDYEVIFVGDLLNKIPEDIKEFKEKIKIIYTKVKPSQCYQIGFNEAEGEYINWSADDVEYSPFALDAAYQFIKVSSNKYDVAAFNCIENGSYTSRGHTIGDKNTPLMAPIGLMSREVLLSLGGYDCRFICGQAENDLVMRAYQMGGKVHICNEAVVYIEHNKKHRGKSKFRSEDGFNYHLQDRKLIEAKWIDKTINDFQPYSNIGILIKSQGEVGEW